MLCTYVSCCFASFSSKDGYRPIFPCLRVASNVIPGSSSSLLGIGPTWGSNVGDLFPSWNGDQEWSLNTWSTPSKTDIFGSGTSKCPSKRGVLFTKSPEITEQRKAGTNPRCPFYWDVRLTEVSVKWESTVKITRELQGSDLCWWDNHNDENSRWFVSRLEYSLLSLNGHLNLFFSHLFSKMEGRINVVVM